LYETTLPYFSRGRKADTSGFSRRQPFNNALIKAIHCFPSALFKASSIKADICADTDRC
jgi:hypothetical protein